MTGGIENHELHELRREGCRWNEHEGRGTGLLRKVL